MFFAPCIVIQLCDIIQTKCTLFKLNKFFSFCHLLRVSHFTGSSSGMQFVHAVFVWMVYTLWCQQCGRWKSVCEASCYTAFTSACKHTIQTSVYNCRPEDGPVRFEICGKSKKIEKNRIKLLIRKLCISLFYVA